MTDPFEPPDDATPETAPAPPTHFGLTPQQWELQGPQEAQRVYAPPPRGYNSAYHPEPLPIPAWTPAPTNSLATSGMVLGILAACFFWLPVINGILAIIAISLAGPGWAQANRTGIGKGKAIAGVCLGVATLVGWFVLWGAIAAVGTA